MQNDIVKTPPPELQKNQPQQPAPVAVEQKSVQVTDVKPQPKAENTTPPLHAPVSAPAEAKTKEEQPNKGAKKKRPTLVITIAVVACIGLSGFAVYLTLSQGEGSSTTQKQPSTAQQATTQQSSASDVNNAISEAESLPEVNDDPAAELSDQSLGL
jgi:hypothetical protein